MSDDDFDRAFGTAHAALTPFTSRLGRSASSDTSAVADDTEPGKEVYKAYGFLPTNTVGETCDVRRWIDGTDIAEGTEFQYRFLLRIEYVGDGEIRLFLPDCIVVIEGKNLRDLRKKLARRQVTFIQQFSKEVWKLISPASEAIVSHIQILRAETR